MPRAHPVTETLVIGGGLAGSAAAALLARGGQRVHLIERAPGPHDKICGEFLSTEAQAHLSAIGLDVARLGGAPIDTVRLVAGDREASARLPFTALGLTRRTLDAALLDHAAACGARVDRGVAVRSIECGRVETSVGDLQPSAVLLATGKHDLRGARRDTAGTIDSLVGFKQYFDVDPATRASLKGIIEVILFDGGYAGLQLVERGVANLCLLVSRDRLAVAGRDWDGLFAALLNEPGIGRRLATAKPRLGKPLTISNVPYGFLHRARADDDARLFRLGDQAGVIPSFSGDGMAIALHSARLAAIAVADGTAAPAYHARLRGDIARQVRLATWLQRAGFSGLGQRALLLALGVMPGAMSAIAAATRVPRPALRRAGLAV
jgi:menaquinone-9 beta-reductase